MKEEICEECGALLLDEDEFVSGLCYTCADVCRTDAVDESFDKSKRKLSFLDYTENSYNEWKNDEAPDAND